MFGREPVIIIAALAALIQGIAIFLFSDTTISQEAIGTWLAPLITLIASFFARRKVMPTKTIEEAGHIPEMISAKAARNRGDVSEF